MHRVFGITVAVILCNDTSHISGKVSYEVKKLVMQNNCCFDSEWLNTASFTGHRLEHYSKTSS